MQAVKRKNNYLIASLIISIGLLWGNLDAQIQTSYFDSSIALKFDGDYTFKSFSGEQPSGRYSDIQSFKSVKSFNSVQSFNSVPAQQSNGHYSGMQSFKSLSAQNYVDHLPLFCKLEVQADAKTNIPVRVRLGTVQYVDQLENKYQGYDWVNYNQTSMLDYISSLR